MSGPKCRRNRAFTVIELIIATAIALVAAGVIVQVLVLTVRTTDQTSSQADAQARARAALMDWEKDVRDAYAVLSEFTVQRGAEAGTVYQTTASPSERAIVAAVPSIDANGAPCAWRGVNVVFDCIVWRAEKLGEGAEATWNLSRTTFPDAFRMPASYFTRNERAPDPFYSLMWGQSSSSTSSGSTTYTVPSRDDMGRKAGTESVFDEATEVTVAFYDEGNHKLAPSDDGTVTEPPVDVPPSSYVLPCLMGSDDLPTTVPISVTNVSSVVVSLRYQKQAATLESGHGEVTQSDTQTVRIRLRNKQTWR